MAVNEPRHEEKLRAALKYRVERETTNPYLPPAPEDGQHVFDGPADLGGNYRCKLCGAYRGSPEGNADCRGEWKESGKMRRAAAEWWQEDKELVGVLAVSR